MFDSISRSFKEILAVYNANIVEIVALQGNNVTY